MRIDKVSPLLYNESNGGGEMFPGLEKQMMHLRIESKAEENRKKPPLISADVMQTSDFVFSRTLTHDGDSGKLLLAKLKADRKKKYLVKHEFTDCACNEFVYTKLAQAMGYCMPDAILLQLSPQEKRPYFKTEYIIGERYLNVLDPAPSYERIRKCAKNWKHFFAFCGLYALTGEADGIELLLADDNLIYRVDTTDAFPISNYQLDAAGINREIGGYYPYQEIKKQLLSSDFSQALKPSWCDPHLQSCAAKDPEGKKYFLEPFARLQKIPGDYIDDFLNTLCYFYPDFIGDFFKRYLSALQQQCYEYWKEKR